ncbi:MAG: DUF3611 family protein, partial [Okeania sp. SIO2D1]|nr:DUF3611 family protein [Okeania sp. SIO2D1]
MSNLSDLPTAVKQVANALRLGGWTCFWSQLALGVISGFMFLFAAFILPDQMNEAGTG